MKIAYNPKTAAALTVAPSNNDITFDLSGQAIYAKGVKFDGKAYSIFKKYTSATAGGYNGLVPAPSYNDGSTNRFLKEDGTWGVPEGVGSTIVSSTASGLAPKIGTEAASTVTTQADEWVLTSTKGATPTWRKLPINAFLNYYRPILVNGTSLLGNDNTALNIVAGNNINLTTDAGKVTINGSYQSEFTVAQDGWYRLVTVPTNAGSNNVGSTWKDRYITVDVVSNSGGPVSASFKIFYSTQAGWGPFWNNEFICIPLTYTNYQCVDKVRLVNKAGNYEKYIEVYLKVNPQSTYTGSPATSLKVFIDSNINKQYLASSAVSGITDTSGYELVEHNAFSQKNKSVGGLVSEKAYKDYHGNIIHDTYATKIELGNYVTLNTNQTITAQKTFNSNLVLGRYNDTGTYSIVFPKPGSGQKFLTSHDGDLKFGESGALQTILHEGNYNNYAPKLDGTGATGDWDINIKGSSSYLISNTTKNTNKQGSFQIYYGRNTPYGDDVDEWNSPYGKYTNTDGIKCDFGSILRVRYSPTYYHDLWFDANQKSISFRQIINNVSYGWKTLLDSSNFSGYLNDAYVKKTGDVISGQLGFSETTYPHIYGNGSFLILGGKNVTAASVVIDSGGQAFRSYDNNKTSLGTSANRWLRIYSQYGDFTGQITSTVADGTAPFVVASKTRVVNLNADYVGDISATRLMSFIEGATTDINDTVGNKIISYMRDINPFDTTKSYYGAILQWSNNCFSAPSTPNSQSTWYYQLIGRTTDSGLYFRRQTNGAGWSNIREIAFIDSDIIGNAATADKLKTKVKLWGNDFDGSQSISNTITINTNKALMINAQSSITTYDFVTTAQFLLPNLQTGHSNCIQWGKTLAFGQSAGLVFKYNEDKNENLLSLGFYGDVYKITIKGNGNVGIGAINPSYKLHVEGNIFSSGFKKKDSSDSYILLGGGGHQLISDFATNAALGNYVTLDTVQTINAYKTFAGTYKGSLNIKRSDTSSGNSVITFSNTGKVLGYIGVSGSAASIGEGHPIFDVGETAYKIWHSGNDGSDSGLDADLLDGMQGNNYFGSRGFLNSPVVVKADDITTMGIYKYHNNDTYRDDGYPTKNMHVLHFTNSNGFVQMCVDYAGYTFLRTKWYSNTASEWKQVLFANSNINGKYINALTGYVKATEPSDLVETDTLNIALGKLEYKADLAYDWIISVTTEDTDEYINKWQEIVDFLNKVDNDGDITDEFVTRKTTQTITGTKTFTTLTSFTNGIDLIQNGVILWNNGNYRQRICNTDDSEENTPVFTFQQSSDGGVNWKDLFTIKDNGYVIANKFVTSGGTTAQFVKGDGSLDSNTYLNTNNYSSYLGYIGTTPVQATSADQGLTGISKIKLSNGLYINSYNARIGSSDGKQYYNQMVFSNTTDTTGYVDDCLLPSTIVGIYNHAVLADEIHWNLQLRSYVTSSSAPGSGVGIQLGGFGDAVRGAGIAAVMESTWFNLTGLSFYTNSDPLNGFSEKMRLSNKGHLLPMFNTSQNLGSSAQTWNNIYSKLVYTVTVRNDTGALGLYGSDGVWLKVNLDDTKAVVLNSTSFKPFDAANGLLNLGSGKARWKDVYTNTGDFSGNVKAGTSYDRHIVIGGDATYVWIDSRDSSNNVKNSIIMYDSETSVRHLRPQLNNTYNLGTTSYRWANVCSILGNFSGEVTFYNGSAIVDGTIRNQLRGTFANNDYWAIGVGATANDTGFVEFRTGDNGNEPIYFAQLNGSTVKNRITLMNDSGNTLLNGLTVTNTITSAGFIKSNSSDSYILLGGGGHKPISDFLLKSDLNTLELESNLTTITKELTVTQDWMDTGISGTDLTTGTYIIQVVDSYGFRNFCSGVVSWYSGNTNDEYSDEIVLHCCGYAYAQRIYLRTRQTLSDRGGMKLQIAANKNLSASTYTFKFKRII